MTISFSVGLGTKTPAVVPVGLRTTVLPWQLSEDSGHCYRGHVVSDCCCPGWNVSGGSHRCSGNCRSSLAFGNVVWEPLPPFGKIPPLFWELPLTFGNVVWELSPLFPPHLSSAEASAQVSFETEAERSRGEFRHKPIGGFRTRRAPSARGTPY